MTSTKKHGLILAALLSATILVYANGIRNPFVPDDHHIIFSNFEPWKGWTSGELFQRSLFSTSPSESTYFRPLTLLSFALNYSLAGKNPAGYRAVNLTLHLSVIALSFFLLSGLTGKWLAAFAALLFALHPVHVQAVTYISSRSDPLYTSLALLCLLFWHKGNEALGIRRTLYLCCALGAFFLGLFAKENIIVVPALAVVMDLTWNRTGSWNDKLRERLPWYGGFVALFAIYLSLRLGLGYPLLMESGLQIGLGSRVLIAFKLFSLYLGLAFYPVNLFLFRPLQVPQSFFEWQVVLGSTLLAGMLILAWLLRRGCKEISFGILWYLISLAPVLNLTLLIAPMMEHWLYLPLIGLALAFVGGVRTLAERLGETRGAALGLVLLALLLSARTVTRNAEWGDLLKLISQNVASYPQSSIAWSWLASTLKSRGMLNEAIHAYKTSLTMSPNAAEPWIGLGEALSFARREKEAEAALSRAVSMQPRNSAFHYILGMHRLKVGRNRAAAEALKKSVGLTPGPMAYHALGSAYLRLGEREKAEQAFQKAMLIYPGERSFHADMHFHLGTLYLSEGKDQEALDEWEITLRFDPNHAEARRLLEGKRNNFSSDNPKVKNRP